MVPSFLLVLTAPLPLLAASHGVTKGPYVARIHHRACQGIPVRRLRAECHDVLQWMMATAKMLPDKEPAVEEPFLAAPAEPPPHHHPPRSALAAPTTPRDTPLVLRFLQQRIDIMGSQIECQAGGGVKQLKEGVRRDLIIAGGSNAAADLVGVYPVRSRGNTFAVDLGREEMSVNGIPESTFFILTCLHLFFMALAFFLVYPIILVIWACAVLGRLVGCPLPQAKVDRWLAVLHVFFFVPLIAIGLGHGIYAMGDSGQFRTQHGIMGLVTVALALMATVIYFVRRRLVRKLADDRPESAPRIKWLARADTVICQVILLLSSIVLTNGLDDFSSMSLCATNVVSLSLAVSLGTIVAFIWNGAMAAGTMEWWLKRRVRKRVPTEEIPMGSRLLSSDSTTGSMTPRGDISN